MKNEEMKPIIELESKGYSIVHAHSKNGHGPILVSGSVHNILRMLVGIIEGMEDRCGISATNVMECLCECFSYAPDHVSENFEKQVRREMDCENAKLRVEVAQALRELESAKTSLKYAKLAHEKEREAANKRNDVYVKEINKLNADLKRMEAAINGSK